MCVNRPLVAPSNELYQINHTLKQTTNNGPLYHGNVGGDSHHNVEMLASISKIGVHMKGNI
jgi:hypothetical protein